MLTVVDSGINWIFVYEVTHEDEDILVLKDLGRFHKFDEDSKFAGKIDEWIELHKDYAIVGCSVKTRKLVEITN